MADAEMSIPGMLGSISLAADTPVRRDSVKLTPDLRPGTPEFDWMLATYCFDLARKLEYICKITLEYAPQGDPAIARQILDHNEQINEADASWETRARRAEAALLELYREFGDTHERILREVAGGGESRQGG